MKSLCQSWLEKRGSVHMAWAAGNCRDYFFQRLLKLCGQLDKKQNNRSIII